MEQGYEALESYVDARRFGRAVRFKSSHGAAEVARFANRLWAMTSFVNESGKLIADGTIHPGLHLELFYDGCESYELILIREPQVTQEAAGQAWGSAVNGIWRIATA